MTSVSMSMRMRMRMLRNDPLLQVTWQTLGVAIYVDMLKKQRNSIMHYIEMEWNGQDKRTTEEVLGGAERRSVLFSVMDAYLGLKK
jgi:hypothetical protein